jgi:two-component system CheB/CheR fusion protein
VTSDTLKIVGIGASAGGVEAFQSFFKSMPPASGYGFVVILHLAPDHRSLLTDILSRATTMPVITASDGMALAPNTVFVIPAGQMATIKRRHLKLGTQSEQARHHPASIDLFFDSLAAAFGPNAIGIVLSGTGHDGALGLKAIRDAGGMTLAQTPDGDRPHYSGMPDSAVAAGGVDLGIAVDAMPAALMNALAIAGRLQTAEALTVAHVDAARLEICGMLADRIGHDFSQYKDKTFIRRVHRRMQIVLARDYASYIARLRDDREECVLLFRDLLIGVTSFFRDAETFETLSRSIIPGLFADKTAKQAVRVWVAGCATGEEAYSIAILLREYAERLPDPPAIQVFATDLDDHAIAAARAGRYPETLLRDVNTDRLSRFFTKTEGGYVISKNVRDICTFSPHSLIRDPPFSQVDLISCRNVLIYLDTELQGHVIPTFHYALRAGGVLLLGSAETVARFETLFTTIDKKHRMFRRKDVQGTLPPLTPRQPDTQTSRHSPPAVPERAGQMRARAVAQGKARVLDAYASAYVVVTVSGEILHYSSRTGRFFEPAAGPPSNNLFDMARAVVRLPLRAAIRRAADAGHRVEQTMLDEPEGHRENIIIFAEPLSAGGNEQIFLIIFSLHETDAQRPLEDPAPPARTGDEPGQRITAALERENRDLREQLQSIREEHETALEEIRSANEELHSVNEEMQSSNEELETSREEIQSVNEEMVKVNAQLSTKLDELDRANSDLKNLFESTKVATIFLDRHLVIRAFTPEVATIYNLIPSDIGRPLTDIVSRLDYTYLREDIAQVLQSLELVERRIAREDGSLHYLMRILPYRTPDSGIDGSLVTFVDVTSIVQAEQHQRLLVDELNHRVKNMLTVVISLASQSLRRAPSLAAFAETFLGRVHALAKAYELLSDRGWEDVQLRAIIEEELRPFLADHRMNITMDGPEIALDARAALAIGMAIHELTTNAVKYGALSVPEGNIAVSWTLDPDQPGKTFVLDWDESGGPAVGQPKRGFGLQLIERGLAHDLQGETRLSFRPTGVHATLRASLRRRSAATPAPKGYSA